MRFLKQLTINLDAVPSYVSMNGDWVLKLDKDICRLLLETDDERITPVMKTHFQHTYNLINAGGELKVRMYATYGFGRRYAEMKEDHSYWGNLVVHSKYIKNTIFHYLGWRDYDQRKGHPTILAEVGIKLGSRLVSYEEYIANFAGWCEELIPYYSVEGETPLSQGDIKDLFNKTIYGGGHSNWVKSITWEGLDAKELTKLEIKGKKPKEMRNKTTPHSLYERFLNDTKFITRRIYDANPKLVERLCKDLPDDSNDPKFSRRRNRVMSYFCGILENEITYHAYKYGCDNGLCSARRVDWGYDGFTIPPPPAYTDEAFHLNAMNEYVRQKTGFSMIVFEPKEFKPETIIQSVIDARREVAVAEPVVAEQIQLIPAENVADAPPEPSNQDEAYMVWKEEFEKEWCKIRNLSVFLREYRNPTTGMFEKNVSKSEKDLIIAYKDKCYNKEENGKTKRVCCIKEWLEDPNMRCYDDAQVIPPPEVCPEGVYNLWREFPYEAQPFTGEDDPEFDTEAVQAFASHLETICGNSKEVFDYVCGWFAHMFQVPAEKPECCLNFVSEEGTGKTIIMNTIGLLCGAGRKLETSCPERDCWGNHNVLMTNAYLVVLSETDKRNSKDADGKIKELITDKADGGYTINPKGKDQFDIRSLHRVIRPTNTTDPTKTHSKDRRNVIIRCSDENVGNTEYFTELIRKLKQPNALRSLYWSFKQADLSNWDFRKRPITDYHKTIIESSRNPLDRFMEAFTFAHRDKPEMVLYGAEMLAEFKAWRDGGGYSFGEKIDEGTLIKKLKLELKLPADTIVKMTRGSKGIRSRYDIGILKKHYGVGLQIPLQQQNPDHLPQDDQDDGVETETEEYQEEENEDEPL